MRSAWVARTRLTVPHGAALNSDHLRGPYGQRKKAGSLVRWMQPSPLLSVTETWLQVLKDGLGGVRGGVQLQGARLLVMQQLLLRFRLMKEKEASLILMQTTVKRRLSHL
jgi:hypothetical protein